jgi:phosphate:Na+ symporter
MDFSYQQMIFGIVGGLGLFLIGMGMMSDGLKRAAGQRLKQLLESMTKQPLMGFGVGSLITALIQSSSATTVIVIGLVNAGLLTLRQAICVIFGTNVGTTATAWIVSLTGLDMGAFNITRYALPAVGVGFLLEVAGKRRMLTNGGRMLVGFGILFIGLGFMEDAFAGIEDSQTVVTFLASLGTRPILALLAGTVVTIAIQSSSAAIAIVQLLAMSGAFGEQWGNALDASIPFVLGANIGTTITAQIAAFRANLGARQTAWAHTAFNVLGAAIALPFVYVGWYGDIVRAIAPWELGPTTIGMAIAVGHTTFNVLNSIIFLPFAGLLEEMLITVVRPRRGEVIVRPVVLEKHLLDTPVLAVVQARREMVRMASTAKDAVTSAIAGLVDGNWKNLEMARVWEDHTDNFQYEITSYVAELSTKELSDDVSIQIPVLLHSVNDLERVGDHAVNIAEIAERKIEQKIVFSQEALDEIATVRSQITEMFDKIVGALEKNDSALASSALVNEKKLNGMQVDFRRNHVQRMTGGICTAQSGLIFIDLIDNVEKVGDHLTNIAQAVIGGLQWDGADQNALSGKYEPPSPE